jgi:type I restriction-modification system DNA methylase subunit
MSRRRGQIIRSIKQEHRQELVDLIRKASYNHSTWRVWDDLMYMGATAITQPFRWIQAREDEYLRRIGQYNAKEQALFPQMFAEIVMALEQEGCVDVLGDLYMELELYNQWKGQFFTPWNVCRMMGKMVDSDAVEMIKQQGYITVHDSCCGSGAMLIAYAHNCKEQEVDYQRHVLFVSQDIDPVVARMCYIQMSLLGMPGYTVIGNSLLYPPDGRTYPECDYLFTPMYYIQGFQWRKQRIIRKGESKHG